jgi:hypothetical protein
MVRGGDGIANLCELDGHSLCHDGQTGHFACELCKGEGVKKVTRPRRTTKTGLAGGRVILFVKEPPNRVPIDKNRPAYRPASVC